MPTVTTEPKQEGSDVLVITNQSFVAMSRQGLMRSATKDSSPGEPGTAQGATW